MKSSYLRAAVAGLLVAASIGGALALNVDQTRIINKRFDPDGYHPNYYRVTINYNDPRISSGQAFGALGQNEFIKAIDCHVTTAFNAAASNLVTLGTTAAGAEIMSPSGATFSITPGTLGIYHVTAAPGLGINATSAADVTIYAKYAQLGTAATAGSVTCVIETVPNNDM